MKYRLNGKLKKMSEREEVQNEDIIIEIVSSQEYQKRYLEYFHQKVLSKSLSNAQYCKVDMLKECAIGTFIIPNKDNLMQSTISFGFYLLIIC